MIFNDGDFQDPHSLRQTKARSQAQSRPQPITTTQHEKGQLVFKHQTLLLTHFEESLKCLPREIPFSLIRFQRPSEFYATHSLRLPAEIEDGKTNTPEIGGLAARREIERAGEAAVRFKF